MLDFEQLAFIEKWRQKASRGIVVVLDGTRGDIVVTLRVGEGPARVDLRGQDATGAVRKHRETGEIAVVDCGALVLVRGDTLPGVSEGDVISFTVASEGKAYLIPTRG